MRRLLLAILCVSSPVFGSVVSVGDPTAFGTGNGGYIDWSQFGMDGAAVPSYFGATGGGFTAYGTISSGYGTVKDKGSNAYLASSPGSVSFTFTAPVNGVGAYLSDDTGQPLSIRINVYYGSGQTYTTTVTSDSAGDPIFVGAMDATNDIRQVTFSVTSPPQGTPLGQFTIGKLYVCSTCTLPVNNPPPVIPPPTQPPPSQPPAGAGPTSVPEPGTLSLLGLALATLIGRNKFKRSARN